MRNTTPKRYAIPTALSVTLIVTACGSDRVDLVDLDRAGGLVRYRVCRDGTPLYEKAPGTFQHFWLQAVRFWCDAEPVLRRGYDDVLRGLTP